MLNSFSKGGRTGCHAVQPVLDEHALNIICNSAECSLITYAHSSRAIKSCVVERCVTA